MNSAPTDPLIGQTLDERYVVRSRIARGGMAMVYLGDDRRLGRQVAIKIMHPHLADDENFTRRFEQEARSAAGLGHPNVVNVFDQGESNGVPYLVMEYLPGITLRELLKQQRQLTPEQAGEIAEALLAGLAAAHEAGIVHRDLKPENVLLADDGRIKIGDFGLARAVSANTTTGQALLGTIAYLSPELVTRGIADARSDLYAFGIVLFEMVTGQQPYRGEQPMQIAYQHAHSDVPLPSEVQPGVPPVFDQLVRWTTQRDADARPSNASEALEYIRTLRQSGFNAATAVLPATTIFEAGDAVTPSTTVLSRPEQNALQFADTPKKLPPASAVQRVQHSARRRKRRGRVLAIFIVLFLALSGIAGWWWGQGPGSRVTIPEVANLSLASAQELLEDETLLVDIFDCSSLTVEEGLAARTEPVAHTKVERGSTVRLCRSTGPELLTVPTLTGITLEEAQRLIAENGFVFGDVREERFGDVEFGVVILATDTDGNELGETYPEQGVIDVILSAGSLPDLAGNSVEQATSVLSSLGLNVDSGLSTSAHHDEIAQDKVIGLIVSGDVVRKGDAVGFNLSLGPELFEVPRVTGQSIREALDTLRNAGFDPTTSVPELFWGAVQASGTDPGTGEMLPAGTRVTVLFNP